MWLKPFFLLQTQVYTQMDKIKREKEDNQYIIPQQRPASQPEYPPPPKRKKVETGLSLFRSSVTKQVKFDQPDWLQNICIANKIHFIDLIAWVQEVIRVITNKQSPILAQSLTKLSFPNRQSNKEIYFCRIRPYGSEIVHVLLRNYIGEIILYQKIHRNTKIQYIFSLLQTHAVKNTVIVQDQTGDQSDCCYLMQNSNVKYKFAYLFHQPVSEQFLTELDEHYISKSINNNPIFYSKNAFGSLSGLQQYIFRFHQFENQEINQFHYILGQNNLLYFPDRYFFLTKVITEKMNRPAEALSAQLIVHYLHQACIYLQQSIDKRKLYRNSHHPTRGSAKNLCHFCRRKKTESACSGCLKIDNKTRYLCIGNCHRKYHEYLKSLSLPHKVELIYNVEYFGQKCRQMEQTMNKLLKFQNGHELLQSFIELSSSKAVNLLNKSVQRRLESKLEGE